MKKQTTKKGFSLIELIVSVFIFSLAMLLLTGSFVSFFKNYSNQKKMQKNFENAQYVMNLMAKTIRTSYVANPTSTFQLSSASALNIYDYSQDYCISYKLSGSPQDGYVLQEAKASPGTSGDYGTCTFPNEGFSDLSSYIIKDVYVSADPSTINPAKLGKVTISAFIESNDQNFAVMPIQMTVSLRQ